MASFFRTDFSLPLTPLNHNGTSADDTAFYRGPNTFNYAIDLSGETDIFRVYDNTDSVTTIRARTIWREAVTDTGDSIDNIVTGGGGDRIIGDDSGNFLFGGGATQDRNVGTGIIRDSSPDFGRIENGLNSLGISHNHIEGGGGNDMLIGDLNVEETTAPGEGGALRGLFIDLYGAAFDRLFGGDGEDTLASGLGQNDELSGGAGSDIFVFDTSKGTYNIMDFENGWDVIVIAGETISDFSGLNITQDGTDAVVTFGDSEITFHDTNTALLDVNDFVFL